MNHAELERAAAGDRDKIGPSRFHRLTAAFTRVAARFLPGVGVDLGTANTLVYVPGRGVVIREPSVIARTDDGQIAAVGTEARRMIGRTPAFITATRPLRAGVIADFETTTMMLAYFLRRAGSSGAFRPRLIMGVPVEATVVEKRAMIDAATRAGARETHLIEEPLAAALGVGLPVADPIASTLVDIGGGRTQVAVITLGGIVTSRSLRVAGDDLDDAITQYVRHKYNLLIGERTAEEIKLAIGSAEPSSENGTTARVRGRDLASGLPRTIRLSAAEVQEALTGPIQAIVAAVRQTLEETPPELAADIIDRGIVLVGGGALLRGIDRVLAEETGIAVHVSADPLSAVVLGTGKVLEGLQAGNPILAKHPL